MANPLMGSPQSGAVSGGRRYPLNLNDVMGARASGFDPNAAASALAGYTALKREQKRYQDSLAQQKAALALQQEAMDNANTANYMQTGVNAARSVGEYGYDLYNVFQNGKEPATLLGKAAQSLFGSGGGSSALATGALGTAGESIPSLAGVSQGTSSALGFGSPNPPPFSAAPTPAPTAGPLADGSGMAGGAIGSGIGAGIGAGVEGAGFGAAGAGSSLGGGVGGMAAAEGMAQGAGAGMGASFGAAYGGPILGAAALLFGSIFANNTGQSSAPGVGGHIDMYKKGYLMVPGSANDPDKPPRWMPIEEMKKNHPEDYKLQMQALDADIAFKSNSDRMREQGWGDSGYGGPDDSWARRRGYYEDLGIWDQYQKDFEKTWGLATPGSDAWNKKNGVDPSTKSPSAGGFNLSDIGV